MRQSVLGILEVDGEFLFIKRQTHLNVFPGYTSFPGGKVDKEEEPLPTSISRYFPDNLQKVGSALIRELREELEFEVTFSPLVDIKYLGKVITPDFNPVRFENFYFLISLRKKPKIKVDINEISKTFWIKPSDFMTAYKKGSILSSLQCFYYFRPISKVLKNFHLSLNQYMTLTLKCHIFTR